AKNNGLMNPYLKDVCIGTSAAPTYLPPYYFKTENKSSGSSRCFHLIDGGIAANNPTLLAMNHVTHKWFEEIPDSINTRSQELGQLLVLSLGTGQEASGEAYYDAKVAAQWGGLGWIQNKGRSPLVDVFMNASADMVDIYIATMFTSPSFTQNYLRIQEANLSRDASSADNSRRENLENLVKIGKKLLDKPMSRVNIVTGKFVELLNEGTNKDALT
ncbi:hypothetical protein KI387_018377, partial [Taxus chinensis]